MNEQIDTSVKIGGMILKNPVMTASGTFGYGEDYAEYIDVSRLGALVAKGIRMQPWPGNQLPRHAEVPGGMVNAIGLQGPGADGFLKDHAKFLKDCGTKVIVNIWGTSVDEYAEVAGKLSSAEWIHGLEINVSCPNVKEGGASFGTDPAKVAEVVAAVRSRTKLTVITKLAPNVPDIKVFAKAAEDAGSDALAVSNTLPAMVIDVETRKPVLANKCGGLSGAGLHPVAVKLVWEAAKAVKIPIIGMGGIFNPQDAVEFLLAGASAVAVGTASFIDPRTSIRVIDGIEEYMTRHGMKSVAEIRMEN